MRSVIAVTKYPAVAHSECTLPSFLHLSWLILLLVIENCTDLVAHAQFENSYRNDDTKSTQFYKLVDLLLQNC